MEKGGDDVASPFTIVFDNPQTKMSGGGGNDSLGGYSNPEGGRERNGNGGRVDVTEPIQNYTIVFDSPQTKMSGDGRNASVGGHPPPDSPSPSHWPTKDLNSLPVGYACTGPCGLAELDPAHLPGSSSDSDHSKTMQKTSMNSTFEPNNLDGLHESPDMVAMRTTQEADICMGPHDPASSTPNNLSIMDSDSELSPDDSTLKKKKKTVKKKTIQTKVDTRMRFQEPVSAYSNLSVTGSDSELSVDDPGLNINKKKKMKTIRHISTDSQNSSEVDTHMGSQELNSTYIGLPVIDSDSELSTDDYVLKKKNKKMKSKTSQMKPIPDVVMEIPLEMDACMGPQDSEYDTEHQVDGSGRKKKMKTKTKTKRYIEPSADDESSMQSLSEGEVQMGPQDNSSSDTELSVNATGTKKKTIKKKTPVIVTMATKKTKVPRKKNLDGSSPDLAMRSPLRPNIRKGLCGTSSESELSSDDSNRMAATNKKKKKKMKAKTRTKNPQLNTRNQNAGGVDTQSSSEDDIPTGSHKLDRSWDSPSPRKNRYNSSDRPLPNRAKHSSLASTSSMNPRRELTQSQSSTVKKGADDLADQIPAFTIVFDNPQSKTSGVGGNTSERGHSRLEGGRERNKGADDVADPVQPFTIVFDNPRSKTSGVGVNASVGSPYRPEGGRERNGVGSGLSSNGSHRPSPKAQDIEGPADMTIVFNGPKNKSRMISSKKNSR